MFLTTVAALALTLLALPGDPPTAQELIDQAAPGSVVYLRPENRMDGMHPLVITKPLFLFAKPRRYVAYTNTPVFCGNLNPAILLQGSGLGTVALYNFDITGSFFSQIPEACTGTGPAPRIMGTGFESLELYNCTVISPEPIGELNCPVGGECYFEGSLHGASAIDVDIDHVLVVGCRITASPGWTWDECRFSDDIPGSAGIDASGSVEVFDSAIIGSEEGVRCAYGTDLCEYMFAFMPDEVPTRGPQETNVVPRLAGPGVRASKLEQRNSLIQGGAAPIWYVGFGGAITPYEDYCGYGWPGLPFESIATFRTGRVR